VLAPRRKTQYDRIKGINPKTCSGRTGFFAPGFVADRLDYHSKLRRSAPHQDTKIPCTTRGMEWKNKKTVGWKAAAFFLCVGYWLMM